MTATLIETLAGKATADRDALLVEYREILARDTAGDAKRLATVIEGLGLTVDDVRRDQGALRDAERLWSQTRSPEALKALSDAHAESREAYHKDIRSWIVEMIERLDGLALQEAYRQVAMMAGGSWQRIEDGGRVVIHADLAALNARSADTDTRRRIENLAEKHPRVAEIING